MNTSITDMEAVYIAKKIFNFYINDPSNKNIKFKRVRIRHLISKLKNSGTSDKTPIFIVGMFRSGTTLVEQILSSHSKVFGGGESKTLTQIVSHFISEDFSNLNSKVFNTEW